MFIQISSSDDLRKDHGTYPRTLTATEDGLPRNVRELEAQLRRTVRGEIRFDNGSQALYATDGSNYRQIPIGVVVPQGKEDVIAAVAACYRYRVPVLNRGGGTSLAGQCCNVAVVIDMSKYMHRVLHLDLDKKLARVEPGCVLDDLRHAAQKHHLTFGPDPATHNHCTLGGMVGNNSCGMHAQMAGKTSDNIEKLEILTYNGLQMWVGKTSDDELERLMRGGGPKGEIYRKLKLLRDRYADRIRERFPKIPRLVSGYPLNELLPENGFHVARALVGTESTCVTVLEVIGNLIPNPRFRSLLVLGYPDVYQAGDHVPEVLKSKPIACEGFNGNLLDDYRKKGLDLKEITLMPDGKGWLLLEFGGSTKEEADGQAQTLMDQLRKARNPPSMKLYDNKEHEQQIWDVRESALGGVSFVPGEKPAWPGWEDSAVAPEKLGGYLRDLHSLFEKYGWDPSIFGHFGQGCLHIRLPFELTTESGLRTFRSFMDEATSLIVRYGGSILENTGTDNRGQSFCPSCSVRIL